MQALEQLQREVEEAELRLDPVRVGGVITEVGPSAFRVSGLSRSVKLGDVVSIAGLRRSQPGEVVRIDAAGVTIKSFDTRVEAGVGDLAFRSRPMRLQPHRSWKGRVINALGAPVDGLGPLTQGPRSAPIDAEPPAAMVRDRVKQPIKSGVRVIDFFTPLCAGQRIGIFAGSGVGKSTMLAMLAMLASSPGFDSVVIALVGERRREVGEFLDDALGENPVADTIRGVGRTYRARPRHRRSGALSRRQCFGFGLASRPSLVEQGAARAGDEIARDDRAFRILARPAADGRLSRRLRSGDGSGRDFRPENLRRHEPDSRRSSQRGRLPRTLQAEKAPT